MHLSREPITPNFFSRYGRFFLWLMSKCFILFTCLWHLILCLALYVSKGKKKQVSKCCFNARKALIQHIWFTAPTFSSLTRNTPELKQRLHNVHNYWFCEYLAALRLRRLIDVCDLIIFTNFFSVESQLDKDAQVFLLSNWRLGLNVFKGKSHLSVR